MERIHVPDKVLKKMKEEQDFEVQENGAQALRSFGFFWGSDNNGTLQNNGKRSLSDRVHRERLDERRLSILVQMPQAIAE